MCMWHHHPLLVVFLFSWTFSAFLACRSQSAVFHEEIFSSRYTAKRLSGSHSSNWMQRCNTGWKRRYLNLHQLPYNAVGTAMFASWCILCKAFPWRTINCSDSGKLGLLFSLNRNQDAQVFSTMKREIDCVVIGDLYKDCKTFRLDSLLFT